ncbi:MAG: hypothetical protein KatS3mg131_1832 [Candidatus Tectimicrobiota bacterium]|nr:MAG: hypothetical protein KatS3mg131_1832 [Candidatus Tectomicrobia bacterium]
MRRPGTLLLLWVLGLQTPAAWGQEALQAYLQAAGTLLATYVQEQQAWNRYFTHVAPQQKVREQIAPQQAYRRFLSDVLARWRQLPVVPSCRETHTLYELALLCYGVAADFRLALLYSRAAWLAPAELTSFSEARARHYTTLGDAYFKQAAATAQAQGCVPIPPRP